MLICNFQLKKGSPIPFEYTQGTLQGGGGGSVNVWGACSYFRRYLTTYEGRLNGDDYLKIVRKFHKTVRPKMLTMIEVKIKFNKKIQDNAPCHTKKTTRTAIKKLFNGVMLPPQSPDLNVIEQIWQEIKSKLPNRIMKKAELTSLIQREWDNTV